MKLHIKLHCDLHSQTACCNYCFVHVQLYSYSSCSCSTDVDECASNPCSNALKCIDLINDYACECKAGWKGSHCNESEYAVMGWLCFAHCGYDITMYIFVGLY